MTDLEIIKNNIDYFMQNRTDKYGRECAKNIINLAATRMSERIGELEKENANLAKFLNLCDYCKKEFATCDSQTNGLEWGTGKGNDNVVKCVAFEGGRSLYDEIDRLKSELAAAKPENCGQCKWMKDCYKEIRLIGDAMDDFEGITFCSFFAEKGETE